jgi:FkbM family methyltransferase
MVNKIRKVPRNIKEIKTTLDSLESKASIHKAGNENIITTHQNFGTLKIALRRNSSDFAVFNQIFLDEEYSPFVDFIKSQNIRIKTIVDAGANIGCSPIYFQLSFPEATITCLEIESRNFQQLNKNISLQNASIKAIKKGLWHKNEMLTIDRGFRQKREWAFTLNPDSTNENNTESIETVTLPDLIQEKGQIDILKIDIEGAEQYLFRDEAFVDSLRKVHFLAMEIHEECISKEEVEQAIESIQFSYFYSGELIVAQNKAF